MYYKKNLVRNAGKHNKYLYTSCPSHTGNVKSTSLRNHCKHERGACKQSAKSWSVFCQILLVLPRYHVCPCYPVVPLHHRDTAPGWPRISPELTTEQGLKVLTKVLFIFHFLQFIFSLLFLCTPNKKTNFLLFFVGTLSISEN